MFKTYCDSCKHHICENEPCIEFFNNGSEKPVKVWCKQCNDEYHINQYNITKRITSDLATMVQISEVMSTPMPDYFKSIQDDLERIYSAIAKFSKHWPKIVAASDAEPVSRGLSCNLASKTKMLTWTMCGRIMVTIDLPEHSVTVMGNDHLSDDINQNGCFFRGIDATADMAIGLLQQATTIAEIEKLNLKVDKVVSYCGI